MNAHLVATALAATAAAGYGISSLLQAIGARQPGGTLRRPVYLAGLGLDGLAWVASLAAVRGLPLYAVQAVLAGSVAVTAVAARVVLGTRLRRADTGALVVTVGALAVLGGSAGSEHAVALSLPVRYGVLAVALLLAAAGWATIGRLTSARASAAPATAGWAAVGAALAGAAFGGTALAARAVSLPTPFSPLALAADPLVWALACFGVTGTLLYASALEHGDAARVTALLWIVEVLLPAGFGVALLGDTVRPGWGPAALSAVLASTAAAVVLASPQPEVARR
ncbi:hypothetical protein [Cryptosporangium arvum]|uniref:hypothetical protein n=1 Tax=Cryptosporangium arvum TaxID=80871 RepID=UPI0004BCBECB|nr:hypothetical protein [Cryptosporangium arvum]